MAESDDLFRAYREADGRHGAERRRLFPVWAMDDPWPTPQRIDETALDHLRQLGDQADEARRAWLDACAREGRARRPN